MSWGESWDKKQQLASQVFPDLDSEKSAILELAKNSKEEVDQLFELETRAQAVNHGVVATNDEINQGRDYLITSSFPSLAKLGDRSTQKASLALKIWEFINECHDPNSGKFCEGDGTVSTAPEKQGFLKKMFGRDSEGKNWQDRKNEQFEKIVADEKQKKNKMTEPVVDPNAPVISSDTRKNSFGFSPQELDIEKGKISAQFEKGTKLHMLRMSGSKWQDNVDAETRANAVLQGRVATSGEIKRGRSKARSANWGGLVLLGIIAK